MPRLSAFTPCGALALSSSPSKAELYYDLVKQLYGGDDGPFDFTVGTHAEAKLYMYARALGLADNELIHAGSQARARTAYDLIPLHELDFALTPGPKDGIKARQNAIAAAKLMPEGARASNVVAGLRFLLGANFLAYVVATPSGTNSFVPTVSPANPGAGPGVFPDVRIPLRLFQLVNPITTTGLQWVAYQNFDTSESPLALYPGDQVAVQGEVTSVAEKVTVVAAASTPPANSNAGPGQCFQATFAKPHDVGASMTTGAFPFWWSTQRMAWIVVSSAAAIDSQMRRKVDEFMSKVARGVSIWGIISPTTQSGVLGTVGPLTTGSPMGTQTVNAFTFQKSG